MPRASLMLRIFASLVSSVFLPNDAAATPIKDSGQYVFVPTPNQRWSYLWNQRIHVGTIDERGTFHLSKELEFLELNVKNNPKLADVGGVLMFTQPAKVYEFRSGRLVLGTMMPDGEFIPEAGSTVLKFEEYKYGQMPTIWNLPGYFARRDVLEDQRKRLSNALAEHPEYAVLYPEYVEQIAKIDAALSERK